MFFDGTDSVHQTMRRIAATLESAGISYVIVGGMAVNAHRHARTTEDVDFLISAAGWAAFKTFVAGGHFHPTPGRPRRFADPVTGIFFDVLVTGGFPGTGLPGPIAYPDPADVAVTIDGFRVVDLPTLVQLKLAAGRYQEFCRCRQLDPLKSSGRKLRHKAGPVGRRRLRRVRRRNAAGRPL